MKCLLWFWNLPPFPLSCVSFGSRYLVYIPVMVVWYISVRHIWFWKIRYIAIVKRIDWYFYIWILPPQVSPTSYFQFRFFIDLLLLLNKKLELNLHFLLDLILNFWIMASSPEPKDNKDLLDLLYLKHGFLAGNCLISYFHLISKPTMPLVVFVNS